MMIHGFKYDSAPKLYEIELFFMKKWRPPLIERCHATSKKLKSQTTFLTKISSEVIETDQKPNLFDLPTWDKAQIRHTIFFLLSKENLLRTFTSGFCIRLLACLQRRRTPGGVCLSWILQCQITGVPTLNRTPLSDQNMRRVKGNQDGYSPSGLSLNISR